MSDLVIFAVALNLGAGLCWAWFTLRLLAAQAKALRDDLDDLRASTVRSAKLQSEALERQLHHDRDLTTLAQNAGVNRYREKR